MKALPLEHWLVVVFGAWGAPSIGARSAAVVCTALRAAMTARLAITAWRSASFAASYLALAFASTQGRSFLFEARLLGGWPEP